MLPKVISRPNHSLSRSNIDRNALNVLYRLYKAGHTVYLVGGGVRDMILGRTPKDFDVVTSARPSQIKKLFRNCRLVGRRFRLAHIHYDQKIIEVSTFRREPVLEGGAIDEAVDEELEKAVDASAEIYIRSDNTFGTPEEDALRRDFTINSLFYDIGNYSLIDYVEGVKDLKDGVIRTIGDPNIRFQEDPVRMIRAIKFCARLGFDMDRATWNGIVQNRHAIQKAAVPRVQEEIMRLLESRAAKKSFELLEDSGLLEELIPDLFSYLQRAENHMVETDPDGQLLMLLLDHLDKLEGTFERPFIYSVVILPLMLELGILRDSFRDEEAFSIHKNMASYFGVCRKSQDKSWNVLKNLRLICYKTPNTNFVKKLLEKSIFPDVFASYSFLADLQLVDPQRFQQWDAMSKKLTESSKTLPDNPDRTVKQNPRFRSPRPTSKNNSPNHRYRRQPNQVEAVPESVPVLEKVKPAGSMPRRRKFSRPRNQVNNQSFT